MRRLFALLWVLGCGDDMTTPGAMDAASDDAAFDAPASDAGDDASQVLDAHLPDALEDAPADVAVGVECESLDPTGSSAEDLVLSQVVPGESIELYNPTDADVDLTSADLWLCSPFIYEDLAQTGAVVPAGNYLQLDWPFGASTSAATRDSGELIVYRGSNFDDSDAIVDFVCWGMRPSNSRRTQANVSGTWEGDCATAIAPGEALLRQSDSDGTNGAAYASAPSRLCLSP